MSTEPTLPLSVDAESADESGATSSEARSRRPEEEARTFPCRACGADLRYHIGESEMICPYCGDETEIDLDPEAEIVEHDFESALLEDARLRKERVRRERERSADDGDSTRELTCESCGAEVQFTGTLVARDCPFCGSELQIDNAVLASERIPIDGVLPFKVEREVARENLGKWVNGRWFAPGKWKRRGLEGRFQGVYLPFWTFDAMTFTRYSGLRGDRYTVWVGSGKNRRMETRIRWTPVSGSFQRFFDDVLVPANDVRNRKLQRKLEPWPLLAVQPHDGRYLSGFLVRCYDVELPEGHQLARKRIDKALNGDVRRRIGGDTQQVLSMDVRTDAVTYKHLLLPMWAMGYRWKKKTYEVLVNAVTGEVVGTRPWSWLKITLAVLAGLAVIAIVSGLASR